MISQPALLDMDCIDKTVSELEKFLLNIIEQPIEKAVRRPVGQTAQWVETIAKRGLYEPAVQDSLVKRIGKIIIRK